MPNLHILPSQKQLVDKVVDFIREQSQAAIKERGRFNLVLSGGATPRPIYENLTKLSTEQAPDWKKTYLFWGDERCVPPDHPDSNYRMAEESLITHIPIPPTHVFRMKGESEAQAAAQAYEQDLRRYFASASPHFDVVLLGMGDDGHTASLFPGTDAIHRKDRWIVANEVPSKSTWRLTMTAPLINQAHKIAFIITGEKKAETLYEVLHGTPQPQHLPAQLIAATDWFLDEAAAAKLP